MKFFQVRGWSAVVQWSTSDYTEEPGPKNELAPHSKSERLFLNPRLTETRGVRERTTASKQQGALHTSHRDQIEEQQQQQQRSTTYILRTRTQ